MNLPPSFTAESVLDFSILPGSALWDEYNACIMHGSTQAAVDETLFRIYGQQGDDFLNTSSIIVDVGGFVGEAAQNFYQRYGSFIFVIEPVSEYAARLEERFRIAEGKIVVFNYGIGSRDQNISFIVDGDNSRVVADSNDGNKGMNDGGGGSNNNGEYRQIVRVRTLTPFFELLEKTYGATYIDLFHVNCQGCEYPVLEYLLRSRWITRIRHLLIQFHNNVDDYITRRCTLRAQLTHTHKLVWDAPFVWERFDLLSEIK